MIHLRPLAWLFLVFVFISAGEDVRRGDVSWWRELLGAGAIVAALNIYAAKVYPYQILIFRSPSRGELKL
jgi:hypothetical protein